MYQIKNFTNYFASEQDVYVQNVSSGQISLAFQTGPGQWESYLFPNTRDPLNLCQFIPFQAIKSSADFRKLINRTPPALKLMTEQEYMDYFARQAKTNKISVEQAMDKAEQKRSAIQNHTPLDDAPIPLKVTDTPEKATELAIVQEEDQINPRVLNLCLQVHPSVPAQTRMTAQAMLAELDSIGELSELDWSYVRDHGAIYKSIKNLANKKLAEFVMAAQATESTDTTDDQVHTPE